MSGDLIQCVWTGAAFAPSTPFQARLAADRFGEGEVVAVSAENERSAKSHRHYFAALKDIWLNLPERCASEQWAQSPEHLRKYLLIRAGFCDTHTLPCSSAAEARRVAAFMRPVDEFSIVLAREATVVRYVAKSQSAKAMGAKAFRASKDAVLAAGAALLEAAA